MANIQVVWFKRDIRLHDHEALWQAALEGPVVCLYAYEPSAWRPSVQSPTHLMFVNQSLRDLDASLSAWGGRMTYRTGECPQVFRELHRELEPWGGIACIWSHQELGPASVTERNQRVQRWCESEGIHWNACPQDGVFPEKAPQESKKLLSKWLREPLPEPTPFPPLPEGWEEIWHYGSAQSARSLGHAGKTQTLELRGGETVAQQALQKLLSPHTLEATAAENLDVWGELQPYLAWGNLSLRQVWQAIQDEAEMWQALDEEPQNQTIRSQLRRNVRNIQHCIQRIQEYTAHPWMECRNLDETFDGMREHDFDAELFQDWCDGNTGYPWIDVCMRHLEHTGTWDTVMFETAVRFATHHLWLHWRKLLPFLSKTWVGFSSPLHTVWIQDIAGTTGRIPIRLDCPTKLARKYDPDAQWIRDYIPELAPLPDTEVHAPHHTPVLMQHMNHCVIGTDYPQPIIPLDQAKEWVEERCKERERLHPPPQTMQPVPPQETAPPDKPDEAPPLVDWASLPLQGARQYNN
ncbi:MAG: hypothetical protein EP343_31275 [Deltaproteobacteria bacterium]|nr:MAG: hypothetical protein EP343_31275 [Deltaproteobacteria bacterium]